MYFTTIYKDDAGQKVTRKVPVKTPSSSPGKCEFHPQMKCSFQGYSFEIWVFIFLSIFDRDAINFIRSAVLADRSFSSSSDYCQHRPFGSRLEDVKDLAEKSWWCVSYNSKPTQLAADWSCRLAGEQTDTGR